jgi:protein FrlC
MLCYSTGSLPDAFSLSRIAETLSPTPFKGVELVVTPTMLEHASDGGYWRAVLSEFRRAGLSFRNVHLGMPHLLGPEAHRPGLSSLDPRGRARKAAAAEKALAIAAFLESPHLTLTTGLPENAGAASGDPATRARQVDALRGVLADLVREKPAEIKILIEQEPEHVINATDQLIMLGREFPGEVFANFDVGHSEVVGEDIGACIRKLGPLLRNIHLEDIRGRVHAHRIYGDGDVDFASIFAALRAIGYGGDYTPDLYPFKDAYAGALRDSEAFLRSHGVVA